jgi:hypothetical protein
MSQKVFTFANVKTYDTTFHVVKGKADHTYQRGLLLARRLSDTPATASMTTYVSPGF